MKRLREIIFKALAVIGALYVFFMLEFQYCSMSNKCVTLKLRDITSPTGSYIAKHEQRRCEGEEAKVVVFVGKAGSIQSTGVFQAPLPFKENAEGHTPVLNLEIFWVNDKELIIGYPKGTKVNQLSAGTEDITVKYQEQ